MVTENLKLLQWIASNRGRMSELAQKAGCSPQFVYLVTRGKRKSKGGKVERMMRQAGAPI